MRTDTRSNRPLLYRQAVVQVQRAFREWRARTPIIVLPPPLPNNNMAFLTSPYDALFDLINKNDRKLFEEACKGLDKEDRFDGSLETYYVFHQFY